MVLPKVLAREVRREALEQPHQLQIAPGFLLQLTARSDAVEVAIDIELEQVGGVIGWSAGILEHGVPEVHDRQVERLDEGVQEPDRIVFGDVLVEGLGEEGQLISVGSLDVMHP